jgi:hypothetical protein
LIYQPVVDVDTPRISPGKITDKLLVRRPCPERIFAEDAQKSFRLRGKEQLPAYHRGVCLHRASGIFMPSRIDFRMPGTERSWSVSLADLQSFSEINAALERLPVIRMGSWESAASSSKLYRLARAALAANVRGIVCLRALL